MRNKPLAVLVQLHLALLGAALPPLATLTYHTLPELLLLLLRDCLFPTTGAEDNLSGALASK